MYRNGKLALPPGNTAWVDYPGKPGTFRHIQLRRCRNGKLDPEAVRGKIVVVGATAAVAQDYHPTSISGSGEMSGPEVEAAAIDTALRGFPLDVAGNWLNLLLAVLLAVIAPLAALRLGTILSLALGLVATAAFVIGAQLAFNSGTIVESCPRSRAPSWG